LLFVRSVLRVYQQREADYDDGPGVTVQVSLVAGFESRRKREPPAPALGERVRTNKEDE
jgi:hypothetical protein